MRRNAVSWHKSGCWRFSKVIEGTRRSFYAPKSIGLKDRAAAERWMHETIRSVEDRRVDLSKLTVEDLGKRWLDRLARQVAEGTAEHKTLVTQRSEVRVVTQAIGKRVASTLTPSVIDGMLSRWNIARTTARARVGRLKTILRWACKQGLIPHDPIPYAEVPQAHPASRRFIDGSSIDSLVGWLESRASNRFDRSLLLLVKVIAETGCRPSEAVSLRWEHWDADAGAFVLSKHKTSKTTGKPRLIVLSRELADQIEALRHGPEKHPEWVFVKGRYGKGDGRNWSVGMLDHKILKLRREAAESTQNPTLAKFHLYQLRHASITEKIQAGMNINDVAALSGNSAKVIESTYLHVQLNHLRKVIDGTD
ncbi:MAG: tyrosine-type recombinase/integrase [Patescibacteria group bacterium]|nr:tyrosine-type recombinase/integrase [Patescibacteria group bacterium]